MLRSRLALITGNMKGFWHLYRRSRTGLFGLMLLTTFFVIAVFAPFLAPYDPMKIDSWNVAPMYTPPVWVNLIDPEYSGPTFGLLGTDDIGRDVLSQIIYGSRISILVGFVSAAVAIAVGTSIGLLSGYLGGFIDMFLMRMTDFLLALPWLALMVVLAALTQPSVWNVILILGAIGWTRTARLVRSQVMSIKQRDYVEAVRAVGAPSYYIMFRCILVNVAPLIFANATVTIVFAILGEAGLSFIGLGDPHVMSWGMILNLAHRFGAINIPAWWVFLPPGLCIALLALSFVLIGRTLDEVVNPRLRRR